MSTQVVDPVAAAVAQVTGPTLALLLYGSYARGDAAEGSDVDLLQVVPYGPRSYAAGGGSIVAYTTSQLANMTSVGSLFAWHLRTEGVVLSDADNILRSILSEHPGPATGQALRRIAHLAAVLEVQLQEFADHGERLLRIARYLLRTGVYARSLDAGEPSFAISAAAAAAGYDHLLPLLSRGDVAATWPNLLAYRQAIADVLTQPLSPNPYGSLEALAVNTWTTDRQLSALAIQALSDHPGEIEYTALPPPVL